MSRSLSNSSILTLCLLFLVSTVCFGQDTTDQIEKRLAGARGRDWVYKTRRDVHGPGNKCKQGESYRFKADHTLVISQCVAGVMHTDTQKWSIESVNALETHVKVGGTSYILRFWDTPQAHFMALRTKSFDKTQPTIDKTFQLSED